MNIREAILSEAEQLVNVINKAYWIYQEKFIIDKPEYRRINMEKILKLFNDKNNKIFVIELENIIGTFTITIKSESLLEFKLFAILPDYQGNKIFKFLNDNSIQCHEPTFLTIFSFINSYYNNKGYKELQWDIFEVDSDTRLLRYYMQFDNVKLIKSEIFNYYTIKEEYKDKIILKTFSKTFEL